MKMPRALSLIAAACLAAGRAAAVSPCPPDPFLQPATLDVAGGVNAVAVGEFTGDAPQDILASVSDVGLVLIPGNGDGTFGSPTTIDPVFGDSLVAADFDGNGTTDFALGGTGWIRVYLGNGNGTFAPPVQYDATGGGIEKIVAADFNGDGKPDLAVTGGPGVVVLLNLGNGTFAPAVGYAFGGGDIASGDIDGDGAMDIVTGSDAIVILHNKGDGTFERGATIPAGYRLTAVAAGDVDGDGHLDIGFTHQDPGSDTSPGYVGILLNNGDGTFRAAVDTLIETESDGLVLLDLDGDGHVDAVASSRGGPLQVLRGNGSASFSSVTGYPPGGGFPAFPAFGDFDGDGLLDVVTGNSFNGTAVSLLFGNGAARLRAFEQILTPVGVVAVAGADFDGDGVWDAVVRGYNNTETILLGGNGDGTFRPPVLIDADSPGDGVVAADFDRDGKNDLAIGGRILLGNGDGTFRFAATILIAAFGAGDVDGDGILDLVGLSGFNNDLGVALGTGDGTFGTLVTTPLGFGNFGFAVADVNGDGKADLSFFSVSGGLGTDTLHVWLSNGDGTFTESFTHDAVGGSPSLFVADVTGEGKADLLTSEASNGTRLYVGHGDGTFDEPVTLDPDSAVGAVAADFDGDGIVDVVLTAGPWGTKFLKGLGAGAFASPIPLSSFGQFIWVKSVATVTGSLPDAVTSPNQANSSFGIIVNSHLAPLVADKSAVVGSASTLGVAASGQGALTYQWRRNGVPLVDGGSISGAATARLVISPVSFDDVGSYDVLVTDSCGSVASNAALLSVEFADVPVSSPFHADILTIAAAGITSGCGGGNYCPTSPVRRDQMAVFLLKSEHGSSYVPPACAGVFADVPCPSTFADWIEQLATEGVTSGCGGGNYCPSSSVTRAQMAVFLLKTKNGSTYVPPPATGIFGDVPVGSFAADFIEALYNQGITGGCQASPLLYCPGNAVLRQQMATFLVRTF